MPFPPLFLEGTDTILTEGMQWTITAFPMHWTMSGTPLHWTIEA